MAAAVADIPVDKATSALDKESKVDYGPAPGSFTISIQELFISYSCALNMIEYIFYNCFVTVET